jgi:hypothetical protein
MKIGRGLVYPRYTMLDDVQIDTSSYVVVEVDMVHENSKDLKLKVPPDNTTLTMRDAVNRRIQWRWTSIGVNPSAAFLASTTPSKPNTSAASIFPETCLSLPPNLEQLRLPPIQEQMCPSPIREQQHRSPIRDQSRWSPPRTQSTLLPAPDQTQQKAMKNVRGKSLP